MKLILLYWIPAFAHLAAVFLRPANKKLDCYFYMKSCTWDRITLCNSTGWISLSREWLCRKDCQTPVSKKLNTTALQKYTLSYSSWCIASMSKRVIIPLSLALVRLCSEMCGAVVFLPHYNREMSNQKVSPTGLQEVKGLAPVMYRDRRKELGPFSLKKRRSGVGTHLLSNTNAREVIDRSMLFSGAQWKNDDDSKLHQGKF